MYELETLKLPKVKMHLEKKIVDLSKNMYYLFYIFKLGLTENEF